MPFDRQNLCCLLARRLRVDGTTPNLPCSGSLSGQRQLKSPCHHSGHSQVFVNFIPSQRVSADFHLHVLQLIIRSLTENLEPVGRKADNPAIGQLHINYSLFSPGAEGGRFNCSSCGIHGIYRSAVFCFQTQCVRFPASHAATRRDCWPSQQARARICIQFPRSARGCETARFLHLSRNENGISRFSKRSACRLLLR